MRRNTHPRPKPRPKVYSGLEKKSDMTKEEKDRVDVGKVAR
jgi:hypothetical protein